MAISRFAVMALLQAARAKELGLSQDSAFSWGLNRAIFYAAAKRGFKGGGARAEKRTRGEAEQKPAEEENAFYLGDEKAFLDEKSSSKTKPLFEIGGEAQTPQNFEKQIAGRFGSKSNFQKAWKEATSIIQNYDEETLKSQRDFFDKVYRPRRDELSKKWSELVAAKNISAGK